MSQVAPKVTWLVRLLSKLVVSQTGYVTLHRDNQSALQIAENPVFMNVLNALKSVVIFTWEKVLEGL